ncbi:MAG: NAD-dependent deacylase [Deltaproteobacteria bacterium]|jgi:NAD-dependent deacetylase|nr:NAD-dependent deacylase [Deltaproteobacteria bacterium]
MIFVLTGAGISKESGLDTFRDKDGLWTKVNIEDVATPRAFKKDPKRVLDFYNFRRRELLSDNVAPNAAHLALARLEAELTKRPGAKPSRGKDKPPLFLVTQNVDNLHERGGSKQVCHTHGRMLWAKCEACHKKFEWLKDLTLEDRCPVCQAQGRLRPDVVWFEEIPYHLEEIERNLARCDLFVSIGTSGVVYPAASYLRVVKGLNVPAVEINLAPTGAANLYDKGYYGPASQAVPRWVDEVLEKP